MNKKVGLVSFTNLVNEILVVFVQIPFWIENLNYKFQFGTLEILGTITYLWIAPMQYKATGIWSCPVWLAPRQVPRAFNNTVRSNRLNDCTLFFFLCSYLRTHSFSCWPLRYSIWIFLSQVMFLAKICKKKCEIPIPHSRSTSLQTILLIVNFRSST